MNGARQVLVFVLLLATAPTVASAARDARLIGKVMDPDGQPIAGVTVVASSEQVPDFREVETTDRRGVFKFDFPQRNVTYTLRFEKSGYMPIESNQEWNLEGTARQEFTMTAGEASVDGGGIISTSALAIQKFNAGVAAFNSRDLNAAEERFREALESDPDLSQAWAALSRVYLDQGRHQQAVEAAEKAIAIGATDESVWRTRWEAYRELGDEAMTVQALKDLENAAIRTEEARGIYNEGVRLAKAGDHTAAVTKFREALEVDPNLLVAQTGLAISAMESGAHEFAAGAAEAILKGDPQNEQALRIRYNAVLPLGNDERLMEALVGIAGIEPQVARDGLLRLAFKVYDANDMAEARKRFGRVLQVEPDHALTHYFLGLINANLGDKAEATRHLRRFVALAPNHDEAASARELIDYLASN